LAGLEHFNSDDFEPEIPEFHPPEGASNLREFNRILPKSMQNLIGRAALCAYWKNHSAADKIRRQAGYT
jgi:hypothetical protein